METGTFLGAFCGPRLRSFSNISCSALGKEENGTALAASLAVSSRTSPSSSVKLLRFAIELRLPSVRFSKADNADSIRLGDIAEEMQTPIKISHSDAPCFALAELCVENCRREIEIRRPLE
jgi:hypothetical protein